MHISKTVEDLQKDMWNICRDCKNKEDMQFIQSLTKEEKIKRIRYGLKKRCLSINPDFEHWLEDEDDFGVLLFLSLLVSLKIYNRSEAYARHQISRDRKYWNNWRKGQKYAT